MQTLVHNISASFLPTNFHTLAVQITATLLPPPLGIPLEHNQLAQLHNLPTAQARLNQLSRLLQTRLHTIHHYRTPLLRMPVVMTLMRWCHSLPNNVWMYLTHVWLVAPNRCQVAALPPALGASQDLGWEEGLGCRGGAEYGSGLAHCVPEVALVLDVAGRYDCGLRSGDLNRPFVAVEFLEQV